MRLRALVLLLALLPLALLIGCFGVSIDASAVESYTQWTVSDTAAFYGDLPFTYEIAGTTFSSTFSYIGGYAYGHNLISAVNIESNTVLSTANAELYEVLVYQAQVRYTEQAIRNIAIPVDIYVSGGFRTFFGIPSTLTYSANSPNPNFSENTIADYPNNFISGGSAALPSASSPAYYNAASIRFPNNTGGSSFYGVTMRTLTYDAIDGTIAQLNFDGAYCIGEKLYLFVATPYSYGDISHDSPTTTAPVTTAPSGTGDINVNVDVDLTETNGLLGSILDALSSLGSSIVNGIKNIFLPDQEDIVNWKQTIVSILNETFGGIPELEEQLKNAVSSIFSATARETVRFEGIKVPAAAGEPEAVIVPAQDVPLKPSGFGDLFSWAETFINIVATIAVANTCFNQIKRIVVGEVVVDAD